MRGQSVFMGSGVYSGFREIDSSLFTILPQIFSLFFKEIDFYALFLSHTLPFLFLFI